jgi:aldehyde dehydrogenase (NAD+)
MTFEYAPAPESRAIVTIKPKYGHFIGGKFVPGGKHFPTINPATEEVLSQIALGGKADVDAAVDAMSSLLEPLIMVVLGVLVGGMVIAMYLPIFKMGSVV